MKKKIITAVALLGALVLSGSLLTPLTTTYAADGSAYEYDGYVYDFWGNAQDVPAAFSLAKTITNDDLQNAVFSGIDDVATSKDGRIFLCDKLGSAVHVFDSYGNFVKTISELSADEKLTRPTGSWYHEKRQELYICDSENKNIYVLDGLNYSLKRVISAPENMTGVTEYAPYKVTVDNADRIFIIVASSYEGIVELNSDGTFSRYFGVNEPKINLIEYFWKSIATDVQKEKLGKTYAPGFTNVALDSEGFIYSVTKETAASTKLFRLNSNGENVIRSELFDLVGDLDISIDSMKESQFIDVGVTDYGVAAVLDQVRGRIFIYDFDGQILNIFGGYGYSEGQFRNPTSLAWLGNKLVVTDTDLKCAYILTPTKFGETALKASEEYYYGRWDTATEYFKECIKLNANYEVAYLGVGKNLLMQDDYENAMYYFKLANSREFYSKAYNGYRGEKIKEHFGIIAAIFLILMALLVWSEVRYHKNKPKEGEA